MQSLAQVFSMIKPDIILVEGDRAEQLIATVTGAYMNIPVAHLQSGDVSGHIDGSARHAITKLCHIHFPACEDSAKRVLNMGEEKWRVFNVGAPQLDEIVHGKKISKQSLEKELGFTLSSPFLVVIQHPVLVEVAGARRQMIETMEAIRSLGFQIVVIYPNIDAGGEEMIRVIREYEKLPFIHTFKNIDRILFLNLLRHTSVLVGNSSCGILEAPSFKLAAVNIGTRQRGRMQASNVLNVLYDKKYIAGAVKKALFDKNFQRKLSRCVNPYGDGKSAARVVKTLETIPLTPELLDKKITC
jgi:UDP-hydrolysing UDP-N-acetyl-D-glucosamine 2-epimerase